jgi:Ribbon-helix-helix protein, copG family
MSRSRLDPSTPEAPMMAMIVTVAMRDRIAEIAAAKGLSRSALMRQIIENALADLEAEAVGQR